MSYPGPVRYTENKSADFDFRGEFRQNCPDCNKEHLILTQADNEPEYHTDVRTFCACGQFLDWSLPVN